MPRRIALRRLAARKSAPATTSADAAVAAALERLLEPLESLDQEEFESEAGVAVRVAPAPSSELDTRRKRRHGAASPRPRPRPRQAQGDGLPALVDAVVAAGIGLFTVFWLVWLVFERS